MNRLRALWKKWLGMKRDDRDLLFIGVFAIVAMGVNALNAPDWVAYCMMFLGGLYIVFTSPKIEDEKKPSVLDKALKETGVQLKGIEALTNTLRSTRTSTRKRRKGSKMFIHTIHIINTIHRIHTIHIPYFRKLLLAEVKPIGKI